MMMKIKLRIGLLLISCVLALLAVAVLALVAPSSVFRRVVTRRMPKSVKEIKADCRRKIGRHTYILRFGISKEDMLSIVDSGGFTKLGYAECFDGDIDYGMSDRAGGGLTLYGADRKKPGWFDLEEWKGLTTYIVEQEVERSWYKARLLLYNEDRGAAYFIEDEMRGHWGGGPVSVTNPRREPE